MEIKKIALNDIHVQLGAKMVPFAGYYMPLQYTSVLEEHHAVRKGIGVFDVSHMGEFLVEGEDAQDLIQWVTSNDISKMVDGQCQYSCLPNDKGGIVDDLLVYKFDDRKFMLVVNASNIQKDWEWIKGHNTFGASMKNISDNISLFAIQGPKALEVMKKITKIDVAGMKYYTFKRGNIGDITDGAIISATGYTGAGGFELYVYNEFARATWDLIFNAGKESGIKPVGLAARDTLRLEMGYCLYGNDIDDTTSPLEGGLGWITKFTKKFVNCENLKAQKERGLSKKLVGFEMVDKGIPRHGYEIFDEAGNPIGHVTSGTMSPSMGIGIGLGYVSSGFWATGNTIYIGIRDKFLKARVVTTPIYKV